MSTLTDCHSQSHRQRHFPGILYFPRTVNSFFWRARALPLKREQLFGKLTQYPGSVFREVKSSKVKTYEPPCKSNSKCVGSMSGRTLALHCVLSVTFYTMSWTQSAWHWQCSNITLKEHMEGHAYLAVYIHHKTTNHWAIDCVTINKQARSWYVNFTLEVKTSSQSCWLSTPVSLDSSAGCRPLANDCGPDETLQGHSHLQVQTMISSNTLLLGLIKPHTSGVSDLTVKSMSEAYCASI